MKRSQKEGKNSALKRIMTILVILLMFIQCGAAFMDQEEKNKEYSKLSEIALKYEKKGDFKKAEKYYLDVLEKGDRKDTELISATIFNLGQLDLEIGEYDKAEYMFKFLADKFPKDTIYSSKLGAFYFVQGKYSEAEKYLKQALNYIKDDKNLENKVKKLLEEIDKKVKK